MQDISIPTVGCSEACPIGPYIEMALDEKLEDTRDTFRQAQRKHTLEQQATHELDRTYDDLGELNIAEFTKDHEERGILAEALGCRALSSTCDGVHCVLAKYLADDVVRRGNLPE
jgi:hypothetical protein